MAFDKDAFLTSLDSMTVMELNDLVKASADGDPAAEKEIRKSFRSEVGRCNEAGFERNREPI